MVTLYSMTHGGPARPSMSAASLRVLRPSYCRFPSASPRYTLLLFPIYRSGQSVALSPVRSEPCDALS